MAATDSNALCDGDEPELVIPKTPSGYPFSLVSFFDVLGTKSAMMTGGRERVRAMMKALKDIPEFSLGLYFQDDGERGPHVHAQDCVFRVTELGYLPGQSKEVMAQLWTRTFRLVLSELLWLMNMYVRFLREGFLIRGALVAGEAEAEEHSAFGPAIVQAFEMERSVAVFPRIVLSPYVRALWGFFGSAPALFEKNRPMIAVDTDGQPFVDYAAVALSECLRPDHYWDFLCEHRGLISRILPTCDERAALWLVTYHNETARHASQVLPSHRYDCRTLILGLSS